MASDLCSTEAEDLNAGRVLKWEEIIHRRRTGKIIEISTGCNVAEAELLMKTQQQLYLVEKKLHETELELAETRDRLTFCLELDNENVTNEIHKDEEGKLPKIT
jgi:hypothetical protein